MTRTEVFQNVTAKDYELPEGITNQLMTPFLVVHLDKVRENLRRMLDYVNNDKMRWRPHLKTTKIPQVWAEMVRMGLRRFKVATTRELAVLCSVLTESESAEGADVLLAYPLTRHGLLRVGELANAYPAISISVLCEDVEGVQDVPKAVGVFVDVNVGMNRSGLPMKDAPRIVPQIATALEKSMGTINGTARFRGLHCYEGHLSQPDLAERRALAHKGYDQVMELTRVLESAGHGVKEIITSGTPGFQHALAYRPFADDLGPGVHQISPGTVVFHDFTVERVNADVELVPAAVLMARVVSRPNSNTVTVDAGSKSIAAEAGDPAAYVIGRPGWVPVKCSEEHMPVKIPEGETLPARGTLVPLIPRHICPTVNLAEEALLVDPDVSTRDDWDGSAIVRGAAGKFSIVPVRGRGHECTVDGGVQSVYAPYFCGEESSSAMMGASREQRRKGKRLHDDEDGPQTRTT